MSTAAFDRTLVTPMAVAAGLVALAMRTPSYGAVAVTLAVGALGAMVPAGRPEPAPGSRTTALVTVAGTVPFFLAALWLRPSPAYGLWAAAAGVVAGVAEELFFRRLVFAWLQSWSPVTAVVGSAALFSIVHLPAYGPGVLAIDFAAGLIFGWQRLATGSWKAPAATHALANLLAAL